MILSPQLRTCMAIPFKWGQLFGTLPFEYDEKEKLVRLTRSKMRMFVWIFSILLTFAETVFLIYQLVRTWNSEVIRRNPALRYSCLLTAIGCAAFLQYQICLALVYKKFPQTFNSLTDYFTIFQEKYNGFGNRKNPRRRSRGRDFWDVLLSLNYYLLFLIHTPMWIYLITTPGHIFQISPSRMLGYAGTEIPYMPGLTVDGIFATTILAVIFEIIITTQILFWSYAVLPLQYSLCRIASQFSMQENNVWTRSILQCPGPFMKVSNQLILLSNMIVEISAPMLLIFPFNLIIAMTYTAYEAIKEPYSFQKLAVGGTFVQLLALYIMINRVAGKFPQVFARNLDHYSKQRRDSLTDKILGSIRVPKMMIYGLFTPGNELIITGLQTVLDNIVSCLTVNTE